MEPDTFALLVVQQYLAENGFQEALAALEREGSSQYDASRLEQGSQLMHMTWKLYDEALTSTAQDASVSELHAQEEALLRGESEYSVTLVKRHSGAFTANLIDMALDEDTGTAYVGAGV